MGVCCRARALQHVRRLHQVRAPAAGVGFAGRAKTGRGARARQRGGRMTQLLGMSSTAWGTYGRVGCRARALVLRAAGPCATGKLWSSEMDSHTVFEPLTSTEREKGHDTGACGPVEATVPAMPRTDISCMSVAATPATTSARSLPERFLDGISRDGRLSMVFFKDDVLLML
jgi:hypothetical protein